MRWYGVYKLTGICAQVRIFPCLVKIVNCTCSYYIALTRSLSLLLLLLLLLLSFLKGPCCKKHSAKQQRTSKDLRFRSVQESRDSRASRRREIPCQMDSARGTERKRESSIELEMVVACYDVIMM